MLYAAVRFADLGVTAVIGIPQHRHVFCAGNVGDAGMCVRTVGDGDITITRDRSRRRFQRLVGLVGAVPTVRTAGYKYAVRFADLGIADKQARPRFPDSVPRFYRRFAVTEG